MGANSSRGRRRALAVLLGLGLLAAVEAALRLFVPDPDAGLFERGRDAAGAAIHRVRPARVGTFNEQRFAARKPEGSLRIFCLGGSSTFGFPWDAEVAWCGRLGELLRAARPGLAVETVNCGGMSLGSARVGEILEEVLRYEPDMVIVDTGHNEYIQARFAARQRASPPWTSWLRLTRLLADRLAPARPAAAAPEDDFFGVGPARDDSRRLPRTAAEDERVVRDFEAALDAMARRAATAGVPFLLLRPASNLADWAPEGSAWSTDLSAPERASRDRAFATGRAALERGDAGGAVGALREALDRDPQPAQAWYLLGRALLLIDRRAEARDAFRTAVDRDTVPIRLTTALGEAIGRVWQRHGLRPLDVGALFNGDGSAGRATLIDYCHPNPYGHALTARFLLEPVGETLLPGQALAPPDRLPARDGDASRSAFGSAWIGQMLLRQGRAPEALAPFTRAVQLDPDLPTAREGLGRTLAMTGDRTGAIRELEAATRLDPGSPLAWNNLGLVQAASGQPEAAVRAFREALRVGGGAGEAIVRANLAQALADIGQPAEARAEIERALSLSPADPQIRVRSGEIAEREGDRARARAEFARALDLDPGLARARAGLERTASP